MQIEFKIDRAGLWWSGLGFSAHLFGEAPAPGEAGAYWSPSGRGAAVRLGNITGFVSRRLP
jgi:hypothetical protein